MWYVVAAFPEMMAMIIHSEAKNIVTTYFSP
jgi:hypothetical protein